MDIIFVFIIGLLIGSFLNVCICRIGKEESIAYPPSHCTSCNYRLKPLDLIPVISYIFLKGKCRSCKSTIGFRYPLVEVLNAVMYVIIYFNFGFEIICVKLFLFVSLLLVIGFIDLDTGYVYRSTVLFGVITAGISLLVEYFITRKIPVDYLMGAAIGFGVIFLIVFITKGMGEGDIDIALLCGLFLGAKLTILTLFIAFIAGGIVGVIILLFKYKNRKDEIPFGPYLVLGAFIAIIWGEKLISMYTH